MLEVKQGTVDQNYITKLIVGCSTLSHWTSIK